MEQEYKKLISEELEGMTLEKLKIVLGFCRGLNTGSSEHQKDSEKK